MSKCAKIKTMFVLSVETAAIPRPLSNGATRVVIRARNGNDCPAAIFLCCVEPPNSFEKVLRESFVTICSVEDLAEYPVGVSSINEVPSACYPADSFLFDAQENKIYVKSADALEQPVWKPYEPTDGKSPNVHTHKLPFFRRSAIDIILPNRAYVMEAVEWIKQAAERLAKDMEDIEKLKPYHPS
jgi:hypothetical protein